MIMITVKYFQANLISALNKFEKKVIKYLNIK